jgi:hypothetical protein
MKSKLMRRRGKGTLYRTLKTRYFRNSS